MGGGITKILATKYSLFNICGKYGMELYMMHQILYSYFFRANHYLFNLKYPVIEIVVFVGTLACAIVYKKTNKIYIKKRKIDKV